MKNFSARIAQKRRTSWTGCGLFLTLLLLFPDRSDARAKFAGEFLTLGAGARALGMGSAFVAVSDDATGGVWTPAGLPRIRRREADAQHAEQFGSLVNHDQFGFAATVKGAGSVGFSLLRVAVDNIPITILEHPDQPIGPDNRPVRAGSVPPAAYAIPLSYARPLSKALALGGSVKLIRRKTGSGTGFGYGLDAGVLYEARPAIPTNV